MEAVNRMKVDTFELNGYMPAKEVPVPQGQEMMIEADEPSKIEWKPDESIEQIVEKKCDTDFDKESSYYRYRYHYNEKNG